MKAFLQKFAQTAFGDLYHQLVLPKHFAIAVFANLKRGFPARNLKVIGVTGTNGKTSTCFLIHSLLSSAGYKTGLMTTVAYGVDDKLKDQVVHMTSQPIQITLSRIMAMKKEGIDWLVLEVTSQALAQFRILGIPIDIAVMTNITHEHLDYHKTFARYLAAKLKLFKKAQSNRRGRQLGIVNANDPRAAIFSDAVKNHIGYCSSSATDKVIARPQKLKLHTQGSQYLMQIEDDSYEIVCHLPGLFNVENSLAAALVGRAIGLSKQQIEKGISSLKAIEGRMTNIDEGQNFTVIADFAHTPDSFEKLLKSFKPLIKKRLIVLFGSAGRRDKIKRGQQGKIAAKYADLLILTEEDDRDEDGMVILEQIAKGAFEADKKKEDVLLIPNRKEAIKKALSLAQEGDMVFLLGKGHEKTIIRADGDHDWDEIGLAKKLLKQIVKSSK